MKKTAYILSPIFYILFTICYILSPTLTFAAVFPVPVLETYIESSITNGSVIETDSVSFKFIGKNLTNAKDKVSFEYYLFPIDKKWNKFSGSSKTFNKLNRGNYTLVVRAMKKYNKNTIYDRTPISITFQIKTSDDYGKIKLSYNSTGKQITLSNSSKFSVNISDWKIKSWASDFAIPKITKYVDPAFSSIETETILGIGEKIIIKTGRSPLGFNFRPNKCFSFLSKSYKFDFSISGYCNKLSPDELFNMKRTGYFTDKCLDFIKSFSCKTPDIKALKKIETDASCVNYVSNNLNYKGCYSKNISKSDFLSKDWRAYINIERFYFSRYDVIRILDSNGLLVVEKKIY